METAPLFTLHRSLTFWLGLPGLLFLIWAWGDSMNRVIWIGKRTILGNARSMIVAAEGIRNHDAVLLATWVGDLEVPPDHTIRSQDWSLELQPVTGEDLFPSVGYRAYPPHASASGAKLVRKDLKIPHWLLLAIYLVFWALGFFLRERRLKRATRGTAG